MLGEYSSLKDSVPISRGVYVIFKDGEKADGTDQITEAGRPRHCKSGAVWSFDCILRVIYLRLSTLQLLIYRPEHPSKNIVGSALILLSLRSLLCCTSRYNYLTTLYLIEAGRVLCRKLGNEMQRQYTYAVKADLKTSLVAYDGVDYQLHLHSSSNHRPP